MESIHDRRISTPTIVGLVVAIAVVDVVANVLVPEPARVPVKLAILCALVAWARRFAGLSWAELGLDRARLPAGLRLGGLVAVIVAAAIALLVLVPGTRSLLESSDVAADSSTRHLLMPLVIIPLGTALFEEVIFRGVLLAALLRATSRLRAVVVSSALFGLWHLHAALSDANGEGLAATFGIVIGTIAVTTAAGALFAYLRLRSGSLAAPVLAHSATNCFAYVGAVVVLHL
jgi:membrane protease YdiL (CAAX protease family)